MDDKERHLIFENMADDILKASGSALRHYDLYGSKEKILAACEKWWLSAREDALKERGVETLKIIFDASAVVEMLGDIQNRIKAIVEKSERIVVTEKSCEGDSV